jgi:hypothetical protein
MVTDIMTHAGKRRKKESPNLANERFLGFQKGLAAAVFDLLRMFLMFFFFHQ